MSQEEEVLGKAYDSRLMKRLLTYLRPYKWQSSGALTAILVRVFLGPEVIGPLLAATAIDKYLAENHVVRFELLGLVKEGAGGVQLTPKGVRVAQAGYVSDERNEFEAQIIRLPD